MTKEEKQELIAKGNEMIKYASEFADRLESWREYLDKFDIDELIKNTQHDRDFINIEKQMDKIAKRIGL